MRPADIGWRRHGVLGDVFSIDKRRSRPAIRALFCRTLRFVESHYGRQMYATDIRVMHALCHNRRKETRSSAMLLFVIATLAREISLYEELIAEYQDWLHGEQNATLDSEHLIADLVDYRTILCIVVRSMFEVGNNEANIHTIVENAILTCGITWTSFDSQAFKMFIARHTIPPAGLERSHQSSHPMFLATQS